VHEQLLLSALQLRDAALHVRDHARPDGHCCAGGGASAVVATVGAVVVTAVVVRVRHAAVLRADRRP
jgi:hypothetical protein